MLQEKYEALDDRTFEAIVRCGKCKSPEVAWEDKQTRSADETATLYCVCTKCKHRWVLRNWQPILLFHLCAYFKKVLKAFVFLKRYE